MRRIFRMVLIIFLFVNLSADWLMALDDSRDSVLRRFLDEAWKEPPVSIDLVMKRKFFRMGQNRSEEEVRKRVSRAYADLAERGDPSINNKVFIELSVKEIMNK